MRNTQRPALFTRFLSFTARAVNAYWKLQLPFSTAI
jgi:hypothetical protein